MVKRVLFLAILAIFLVASTASAFELVEQRVKEGFTGLGLEGGKAFGSSYSIYFYGIAGNYNFTQHLGLKASLGLSTELTWEDQEESSLYFTAKPTYYLFNKKEVGLYGFALLTNISPNLISLGAGGGVEIDRFNNGVKIVTEFSYSLDRILIYTGGFKIYF